MSNNVSMIELRKICQHVALEINEALLTDTEKTQSNVLRAYRCWHGRSESNG